MLKYSPDLHSFRQRRAERALKILAAIDEIDAGQSPKGKRKSPNEPVLPRIRRRIQGAAGRRPRQENRGRGTHAPDGDCVSSQFAAADFLRQAGAAVVVCVNQNKVPYLYENFAVGETMLDAETFDDASFDIMTVDWRRLRADKPLALQTLPRTAGVHRPPRDKPPVGKTT